MHQGGVAEGPPAKEILNKTKLWLLPLCNLDFFLPEVRRTWAPRTEWARDAAPWSTFSNSNLGVTSLSAGLCWSQPQPQPGFTSRSNSREPASKHSPGQRNVVDAVDWLEEHDVGEPHLWGPEAAHNVSPSGCSQYIYVWWLHFSEKLPLSPPAIIGLLEGTSSFETQAALNTFQGQLWAEPVCNGMFKSSSN